MTIYTIQWLNEFFEGETLVLDAEDEAQAVAQAREIVHAKDPSYRLDEDWNRSSIENELVRYILDAHDDIHGCLSKRAI